MKTEAVIFDLDGTLADSHKIHVDSYIIPLNKRGIYPEPEDVLSKFGAFDYVIFKNFATNATDAEIKRMITERNQVLLKEVNEIKKMPYSDELLNFLKGKVKIGLASGTSGEVVNKTLEILNWKKYFDAVTTGSEVSKSRPDPETLQLTLNKLNFLPTQCFYVGDTIYDVQCAKNANIKIIALGDFKEADYIAKNLLDVKDILKRFL